jgi:hypothetical protein
MPVSDQDGPLPLFDVFRRRRERVPRWQRHGDPSWWRRIRTRSRLKLQNVQRRPSSMPSSTPSFWVQEENIFSGSDAGNFSLAENPR